MFFSLKKSFKRELKKQMRLAIAAACGFIIAFAWRDALFNIFEKPLFNLLQHSTYPSQISYTITAILLTILGVLILIFSSKWLTNSK